MMALDTKAGLYISWTPIGTTCFIVQRNKLFEHRLKELLHSFATMASQKLPYETRGDVMESTAAQLYNEAHALADAAELMSGWASVVDESAKKATLAIARKVDKFHKNDDR